MAVEATIGIFGGSGFYALADHLDEVRMDTPFGAPSGPLHVGEIEGRTVAFLARHGTRHEYPAHRVDYRANLWAFRRLGITAVIGPFAAGSLQPHLHPGDFVVVDQLVDRTTGRVDTFYDGPEPYHLSAADPYCPALRALTLDAASRAGITAHDGATTVVIQGPRFATRAESRWYRAQGWDVINMTQYPEAILARELGMCYAGVALITDYDTGVEDDPTHQPVTQEAVFRVIDDNVDRVRVLINEIVARIEAERVCSCHEGAGPLPAALPVGAS